MPKRVLVPVIALAVAALVVALNASGLASLPPAVSFVSRWAAIAALTVFAGQRRSLTTWILVAIVVGAEVGHDFPVVATNLRVLSQIFLRLIRTIVAPLLFATLVVGIAGHSNLKQVGRMGIKSLIYFEVVTTLALAIGWVAITLSKAGVGVAVSATGIAGAIDRKSVV